MSCDKIDLSKLLPKKKEKTYTKDLKHVQIFTCRVKFKSLQKCSKKRLNNFFKNIWMI